MGEKPVVTTIEAIEFSFTNPGMERGSRSGYAIRIETDQGVTGEYVGGWREDHVSIDECIRWVLGRNALDREGVYNACKHAMRQAGRIGFSVIDVALWDLAGKWYGVPVYELLGAVSRPLPAYASTVLADDDPDGLGTPEAYANFAERCLERGYPAFKIHGWFQENLRREIETARVVAERVGDRMDLMDDVSSLLSTFGAAVKLGRVLDEYGYFWYEDPFRDGGISAQAHARLRERIRTPLLMTEHLRSLEPKIDFLVAGGTDFLRADPDYDGGITGVMKIAHAAEGLGADVELHFCGPAHRHLMCAMRNSNYYEMGLLHPQYEITSTASAVAHEYRDGFDAVDKNGFVYAPEGPGLGVEYDWDRILATQIGGRTWRI